jgi:predicted dehydrogenase
MDPSGGPEEIGQVRDLLRAWLREADAAPGEEERMLALDPATGSGARDPKGITTERHRAVIAEFVRAIREHRPPAVSGEEARKSVEIIRAIYRSSALGQPVELPLSGPDTAPDPRPEGPSAARANR